MPDREKLIRIVGLSAIGFLIMLTYSIARPATESIFLQSHTSSGLPLAWLLTALGMLGAVTLYNRVLGRRRLLDLFTQASLLSAAVLTALLVLRRVDLPGVDYLLYAFKEVHIVVLVEIYYSFANAAFPIRTARWVYGLFGVFGSTGAIVGNLAVGQIAEKVGSANALVVVVGLLLVIAVGGAIFARIANTRDIDEQKRTPPGIGPAFRVVRGSSYLALIALLVALLQVAVTLVDFQFNAIVEQVYPDVDQRTGLIGQVYAVVSVGTLALHALTGPILRLAGVPLTLLAVPLLLGVAAAGMTFAPGFAIAAVGKVMSKVLDYTLFRAGKEILYIPLSYAEKTAGKSVADMLTYRVAKGGASLMLMGVAALGSLGLVAGLTLGTIAGWFGATMVVARRFRARVSRTDELGGQDSQ